MSRRAVCTALVLGSLVLGAGLGVAQPAGPALAPGQSATLLPDSRWLLIGGDGASGPQGTVTVWDPGTGALTALPVTLDTPRSGHAATLLPDGTVLVAGGVGPDGRVLDTLVRIDPATAAVDPVPALGVTPRVGHTATVLTDGRVLFAGGVSAAGTVLETAELWDPPTGRATPLAALLGVGRFGHTAALQAEGTVVLWGGQDAQGATVTTGERVDPGVPTVTPVPTPPVASGDPPTVAAGVPADGAVDVLPDAPIALRFSSPPQVESVSGQTVFLSGPQGFEPARVVPVEGGRLVFITPAAPLQAGALYEVVVNGPVDAAGRPVPFTSVHFSTAASGLSGSGPLVSGSTPQASADPTASLASSSADDVWTLDVTATGPGRWRTGWPDSPWRTLAPLRAAPGVTALAGQVLTLRGDPLPDVTLGIGSQSARTDATGRFLLTDLPPGHQKLLIDGRSATRPGRVYGVFEVGVDLTAGQTTVLPYTIWMPRIDTDHAVTIPSPTTTEVVVTTPRIPGLELRLPAGAVITDHEHRPVTQLTITPIPLDRPPFPLAIGVEPPAYFTIQPGGGYLYAPSGRGAQLIYPNTLGWSPGAYAHFWHYSPEGPGWYVYGNGRVTPDGRRVLPDPGTELYEFTGAMASIPRDPPTCAICPPPPDPPDPPRPTSGDPVELTTGLFVLQKTDLVLPDVIPLTLTRMYRSGEGAVRWFGRGMMHPYDLWLRSLDTQNPYQTLDLTLPDSATVRFVRTSGGPDFASSVLEHKTTPTVWHGSKIVWNGGGWDLTRRDGMVYVFGDNAPLREIRDRFGNRVTVDRVNASLPAYKVTSPHGRWLEFTLTVISGWQLITQARDNLGRVVTYQYDADLRLWKVTDPLGGVTEYGYDANHLMTTITDARGIVYLKNEYSGPRVARQVLADGTKDAPDPTNTRAYQFAYTINPQGWSTQVDVTDPRGHVQRVTNQPAGYILTDTRALGQSEQQTTTYERDSATNLITARVDPLLVGGVNRRTEYTYNLKGDRLTMTQMAGTPEAVTTTFTYEDNATQPVISQLKTITPPTLPPTTFTYNAQGALTEIADPLGQTVTITPNAKGQPAAISTHSTPTQTETTQFGYDGLGDLVTITDPLNRVTTRFVDDAGRLLAVTDPLGRRTRYEYDGLNRLTKVTDPVSGTTQFQHDPNGNLRLVTDARGKVTEYTYDNADRVATRKDPLLRTESYQYDGVDNLTQLSDRKGQVGTFTYDALQRQTEARFSAAGPVTSLSYDAAHRVTQVKHSADGTTNIHTITRSYDGLDRLTQETTPQGTVAYGYDAASRRTSVDFVPAGPLTSLSYDAASRLTRVQRGVEVVTLEYDDANRRTAVSLPSGIRVESTYDAASQLTALDYRQGVGGPLLGNLTYTYDLAGQRTKVGGSWARTGLPAAVASASYDDVNQQLTVGGTTLTYDDNGNLKTLTDAAATTTYTWSAKNELTALARPGLTASFDYDGLGRRTKKVIGATTTEFLYDGLNPVQEKNGAAVLANLLTGLGLDEVFRRTDAAGARDLLSDPLGSTLALADGAGTVQTEYTYEPFGTMTATGQSSTNSFTYTGREDDGSGLYYYRARYYHPALERFIAEDPRILLSPSCFGWLASMRILTSDGAEGFNQYAYARDNPLLFLDSTGHEAQPWRQTFCPPCERNGPCRVVRDRIVSLPANNPDDAPDEHGRVPPRHFVPNLRRACTYKCPGGSRDFPEFTIYRRCIRWHNI